MRTKISLITVLLFLLIFSSLNVFSVILTHDIDISCTLTSNGTLTDHCIPFDEIQYYNDSSVNVNTRIILLFHVL